MKYPGETTRGSFCIILSALLCLVLVAGCGDDFSTESTRTFEIAVNGTLISGADRQYLSIVKVMPEFSESIQYVNDAHVEVNGVRFSPIPLDEIDPTTASNWTTSDLVLQCGQICSLQVIYKDEIIEGITIIPNSVEPVVAEGSVVRWQGDSLRTSYDVIIPGVWGENNLLDNSYDFRQNLFDYQTGQYRLVITAHDENYSAAWRDILDGHIGDSFSVGIKNAYGILTSACVWEGEVELE